MNPYSNSPAHRMRGVYARMHRMTNRIFRPYGVTADQYVVLRILAEGDGISQQELGDKVAADPTSLGRMLELLQSAGYVDRKVLESDRRSRLVFLTDAGIKILQPLYEAARPIRELVTSTVTDQEMQVMLLGLANLSDAFKEAEAKLGTSGK